jgi:hypothetical protein
MATRCSAEEARYPIRQRVYREQVARHPGHAMDLAVYRGVHAVVVARGEVHDHEGPSTEAGRILLVP